MDFMRITLDLLIVLLSLELRDRAMSRNHLSRHLASLLARRSVTPITSAYRYQAQLSSRADDKGSFLY